MTLEEFKASIGKGIKNLPSNWRRGQKVFNFIEENYHVARKVQFEDHIDCFYDDSKIDEFINASYSTFEHING